MAVQEYAGAVTCRGGVMAGAELSPVRHIAGGMAA
jgi:hypothetical protein